jgi:hypothetical protein
MRQIVWPQHGLDGLSCGQQIFPQDTGQGATGQWRCQQDTSPFHEDIAARPLGDFTALVEEHDVENRRIRPELGQGLIVDLPGAGLVPAQGVARCNPAAGQACQTRARRFATQRRCLHIDLAALRQSQANPPDAARRQAVKTLTQRRLIEREAEPRRRTAQPLQMPG